MYSYLASDAEGATLRGEVAAENARHARDQLRARGLVIEAVSAVETNGRAMWLVPLRRARNAAQTAESIHELATLVGVGIPLTEAIDTVGRQHSGTFRRSMVSLRDRVAAGVGLAEAMGEQPDLYDSLCIHMVEVGENAGNLDTVLHQLAAFKTQSLELKDRVLSALLYRAIVLSATIAVTLFLGAS